MREGLGTFLLHHYLQEFLLELDDATYYNDLCNSAYYLEEEEDILFYKI